MDWDSGLSTSSWLLITVSPPPWQNLTYEIILTLGQAFEVAYQLALQAQRTRQQQSTAAATEIIETKSRQTPPQTTREYAEVRGEERTLTQSRTHSHTHTK